MRLSKLVLNESLSWHDNHFLIALSILRDGWKGQNGWLENHPIEIDGTRVVHGQSRIRALIDLGVTHLPKRLPFYNLRHSYDIRAVINGVLFKIEQRYESKDKYKYILIRGKHGSIPCYYQVYSEPFECFGVALSQACQWSES